MTISTKLLTYFLIGFTAFCSAQIETSNFKRTLSNVNDEWHKLTLPNAVFGKVNPDFSDLRIYGITAKNDTIEAPYLLRILSEEIIQQPIHFEIINKTKGENGYYFTFQVDAEDTINQIKLNFDDQNFDWKVDLQGSQNQQEWFTVLEDYRILSIKNETTNYKFTTLNFPKAKYHFFRLLIKHTKQPQLQSAQISKQDISNGSYIDHFIKSLETTENKQDKTTKIDLELREAVSISELNIKVSNTFDYYRPLKIEYKNDSIKTEKGWKYYYKTIASGTLNSLEANRFKFSNTIVKNLRIIIYNRDNQPLDIEKVSIKGYEHQLIARFTEKADYMLVYGNPSARLPNYDINKFEAKVPKDLKSLEIGVEEVIVKNEKPKVKPLFENKYWLWGIIGLVILILGGFTFRMLKKS